MPTTWLGATSEFFARSVITTYAVSDRPPEIFKWLFVSTSFIGTSSHDIHHSPTPPVNSGALLVVLGLLTVWVPVEPPAEVVAEPPVELPVGVFGNNSKYSPIGQVPC